LRLKHREGPAARYDYSVSRDSDLESRHSGPLLTRPAWVFCRYYHPASSRCEGHPCWRGASTD
jgi:hypothetical protein